MAISYTGMVASSIIQGSGNGTQGIFCIENSIQSRVKVYVKRLYLQSDAVAVLTAVKPVIRSFRATNITGTNMTIHTKGWFDSAQTSDPNVKIWSGATPSYTGTSGLAGTLGQRVWNWMGMRMHDLTGAVNVQNQNMLPQAASASSVLFTLYPGESLLTQVVPAVATSDPLTNSYFVNCVWQEEPITTYTISGTVTLSGTGVVGAEVTVLIADDTALTNAYLYQVVTTTTGGAWSCTIPNGKFAYSYAQNYTGGVYYTATGNPFVS